jgi:sphinganine-1-phosphate aldolase
LAYREQARERGVKHPNMVMSQTAHAAFDKAAFYFGVEIRKVSQTHDLKVDLKQIAR